MSEKVWTPDIVLFNKLVNIHRLIIALRPRLILFISGGKYVIKFIRSFSLKQKFYSPKEVKRVGLFSVLAYDTYLEGKLGLIRTQVYGVFGLIANSSQ